MLEQSQKVKIKIAKSESKIYAILITLPPYISKIYLGMHNSLDEALVFAQKDILKEFKTFTSAILSTMKGGFNEKESDISNIENYISNRYVGEIKMEKYVAKTVDELVKDSVDRNIINDIFKSPATNPIKNIKTRDVKTILMNKIVDNNDKKLYKINKEKFNEHEQRYLENKLKLKK